MSDCSGNAGIVAAGGYGVRVGRNDDWTGDGAGSGMGEPGKAGKRVQRKQKMVKSGGFAGDIGREDRPSALWVCTFGFLQKSIRVQLCCLY